MALTAGEIRKSVRRGYKTVIGTGDNAREIEVLVLSAWYGDSGINVNVEFTAPSSYSPTTNKTEIENTVNAFIQTMNGSLNTDNYPRVLSS